jgi:hypothetical protein
VLYQLSYWPNSTGFPPQHYQAITSWNQQSPTPAQRDTIREPFLLRLAMRRVPTAPSTVFLHLKTIGHRPLVLRRVVVTSLALGAGENNDVAHNWKPFISVLYRYRVAYSTISVIVPEPTVRPPSRIANRRPFSKATGVINSTLIATLSPGITISTPSGRFATPVTSVVRR